jgi:hypothetical protein
MRVPFYAAKTIHRDHLHGALASLSIGVAESTGVDEALTSVPAWVCNRSGVGGFPPSRKLARCGCEARRARADGAQDMWLPALPLITPQQSHTELTALI